MKIFTLAVLFIASNSFLFSQYKAYFSSPTQTAGAVSADTSAGSAFANPASSAFINRPLLGLSFENKYLIPELSDKSVFAYFPTKYLHLGLMIQHSGYSLFHSFLSGFSLSRDYQHKFSLGLRTNLYSVFQSNEKKYRHFFHWQLGFIAFPHRNLVVGFDILNPLKADTSVLKIPTILATGINLKLSQDVHLLMQFDAVMSGAYKLGTGLQYHFAGIHRVGAGLMLSDHLSNDLFYGLELGKYKFSSRFVIHPVLGISVTSSILYQL